MISAYGYHGQPREALYQFDEMQKFGVKPDGVTFLAVLSACGTTFLSHHIYFYSQSNHAKAQMIWEACVAPPFLQLRV
jgi:pentatricopeptide repeat protein